MEDEPEHVWTTAETLKVPKQSPKSSSRSSDYVAVQSKFHRKYGKNASFHLTVYAVLFSIILMLTISILMLPLMSPNDAVCLSKECLRTSASFLSSMDLSADPCTDFYQFTCGKFDVDHPREDFRPSSSWFSVINNKVEREMVKKLEATATDESVPASQVKALHQSCLHNMLTNVGISPLLKLLRDLELPQLPAFFEDPEAEVEFDWIGSITRIRRVLAKDLLIGFDVFPEPKNSSANYFVLGYPNDRSGLPLFKEKVLKVFAQSDPEDEFSGKGSRIAKAFLFVHDVLKEILNLTTEPSENTEELILNATQLLFATSMQFDFFPQFFDEIMQSESETETEGNGFLDDLVYITIPELQEQLDSFLEKPAPVFERYLKEVLSGVPQADFDVTKDVILTSKGEILYLQMIVMLIDRTPPLHMELLIWWNVVEEMLAHSSYKLRKLFYDFTRPAKYAHDIQVQSKFCVYNVNRLMGYAVASLMVDPSFLTETQPKVYHMFENIRRAFNTLVHHAEWMDYDARQKTLKKSAKMRSFIGFPDWMLNQTELAAYYHGIDIKSDTWLENVVQLQSWKFLQKFTNWRGKRMFEWDTVPFTVNAFYRFQTNAMNIPMGILQFPMYNLGLEVLNYGAVGSILGHELTHGFDNVGRLFDENGNLNNSWSNETVANFVNRSKCFVKQYNEYKMPEIQKYVNGFGTLPENIADNGGLREAFYAYNYYVQSTGKEPNLPGFESYTHEQLFFMAYGNIWCEILTPRLMTHLSDFDPHAPGRIRVMGSLANFREFQDAFNCKSFMTKYYRTDDEKCIIW